MIHYRVRRGTRALELIERHQQQRAQPRILQGFFKQRVEQRLETRQKAQRPVGEVLHSRPVPRIQAGVPVPCRGEFRIETAAVEHPPEHAGCKALDFNHWRTRGVPQARA